MKRVFFVLLLLVVPLSSIHGQQQYAWSDSLTVTTVAVDTTFSPRWNGCTLWFEGCRGWIRFATSVEDSVGWSTTTFGKKWVLLEDGQTFGLWQTTFHKQSLWKLEYKSAAGTGALFIVGYKNRYE